MSIVLSKHAMGCFEPDSICTVCGEALQPPFAQWCGLGGSFFVCGPCAVRKRAGITADLVQLAGIVELQGLGYGDLTLVRRPLAKVEQEQRRKHLEMQGVTLLPRDPDGGDAA